MEAQGRNTRLNPSCLPLVCQQRSGRIVFGEDSHRDGVELHVLSGPCTAHGCCSLSSLLLPGASASELGGIYSLRLFEFRPALCQYQVVYRHLFAPIVGHYFAPFG